MFHRHNITKRIDAMGKGARYFSEDLYLEHLEEVSFLYESRLYLMREWKGSWMDLETVENRIQAHIDGLVMGGLPAIDICRQKIKEGTAGVLYAAVRVLCRHDESVLFKEILSHPELDIPERAHEIIDGLNHDLPLEWQPLMEELLLSPDPWLKRMALSVCGYRRLPVGQSLMDCLAKPQDETFGLLISTLGRIGVKQSRDYLYNLFHNGQEEDFIKHELCMALLRLQVKGLVSVPADGRDLEPWMYQAMGLCGGRSHASYLNDISRSHGACNESLLALGFLGDVSSVDTLISHLDGGAHSETASLALHLITGAGLYEDVFVPDPIDEDTLFDDERERLRKGEPVYPPGKEPGITLHRVSQNPVEWKDWWRVHKIGFDIQTSYRYGKQCSLCGVLETLESETNPARLRQMAYEECVIRYNKDVGVDTTTPVSGQRIALNEYRQRIYDQDRSS
jgi:uncharacterized protein (TIGR02270 family)